MNQVWWRQLSLRFRWSTKNVERTPPYEKLAVIYDHVMRHVDYREWAVYANDLIRRWLSDTKNVLDVACGTGNLLLELKRFEYQLYGCDSSYPMVLQASYKRDLKEIPFWQCDMSNFGLKRKMDVVLCLYDSFNYIMTKENILNFLNTAHQFMCPKGLLIFDICTEQNSLNFFLNYYDHEKNDEFYYYRWSHYDQKKKIQFTEFKMKFKDDSTTYLEVHQQRIYSVKEIHQLVDLSQFELLDVYDGFSFRYPDSMSSRIHFVLQRRD